MQTENRRRKKTCTYIYTYTHTQSTVIYKHILVSYSAQDKVRQQEAADEAAEKAPPAPVNQRQRPRGCACDVKSPLSPSPSLSTYTDTSYLADLSLVKARWRNRSDCHIGTVKIMQLCGCNCNGLNEPNTLFSVFLIRKHSPCVSIL